MSCMIRVASRDSSSEHRIMPAHQLALVIADIISAHCPGTSARERFLKACISTDWDEAASMVDGMLAEPWHLRGRQERRLHEFLELISDAPGATAKALWQTGDCDLIKPASRNLTV